MYLAEILKEENVQPTKTKNKNAPIKLILTLKTKVKISINFSGPGDSDIDDINTDMNECHVGNKRIIHKNLKTNKRFVMTLMDTGL